MRAALAPRPLRCYASRLLDQNMTTTRLPTARDGTHLPASRATAMGILRSLNPKETWERVRVGTACTLGLIVLLWAVAGEDVYVVVAWSIVIGVGLATGRAVKDWSQNGTISEESPGQCLVAANIEGAQRWCRTVHLRYRQRVSKTDASKRKLLNRR